MADAKSRKRLMLLKAVDVCIKADYDSLKAADNRPKAADVFAISG